MHYRQKRVNSGLFWFLASFRKVSGCYLIPSLGLRHPTDGAHEDPRGDYWSGDTHRFFGQVTLSIAWKRYSKIGRRIS
jgi:hypothetical protein